MVVGRKGDMIMQIGGMELIPSWVSKTDPEKHPVRFLVCLWQQRLASNFGVAATPLSGKQYGQFVKLRDFLGDLTQHVIESMLQPKNWFDFTQQVRVENKLFRVPDYPDIGFLLKYRNEAVKNMRWDLRAWLMSKI